MALVVLLSIVVLHMYIVIRYIAKCGATLPTTADHFPCVDTSVRCQAAPTCERLPADVTHELLLLTMSPTVCRQTTSLSKRLATVVTAEWPLSRVCSFVISHILLVGRGVLAPLTLVSAVPTDVAVTLLHVQVQMILSQTFVVAVDAVMYLLLPAFTWREQRCSLVAKDFGKRSATVLDSRVLLKFTDPLHRFWQRCVMPCRQPSKKNLPNQLG